jgi:hypothetical protein
LIFDFTFSQCAVPLADFAGVSVLPNFEYLTSHPDGSTCRICTVRTSLSFVHSVAGRFEEAAAAVGELVAGAFGAADGWAAAGCAGAAAVSFAVWDLHADKLTTLNTNNSLRVRIQYSLVLFLLNFKNSKIRRRSRAT